MKKGDIKWFKGYRKVKIIKPIDSQKVKVKFLEGIGNVTSIVDIRNLTEEESPRAKKERIRIEKIMQKEQEILDKLKGC